MISPLGATCLLAMVVCLMVNADAFVFGSSESRLASGLKSTYGRVSNKIGGLINRFQSSPVKASYPIFKFRRVLKGSYFMHTTSKIGDGKYARITTGKSNSTCGPKEEAVGKYCYQKCRDGYKRYYSNLCITKEIQCPPGFKQLKNGECLLENCPSNLKATDKFCEEKCPSGFSRKGEKCTSSDQNCPVYYEQIENQCFLKKCRRGQIMLNEAGCVDEKFMRCPKEFEACGSICKRCKPRNSEQCLEYDMACPEGWRQLSPEKCTMVCPSGTAALGKYCVSLGVTGCPSGYLHIEDQGCVLASVCPKGYEMVDKSCVLQRAVKTCASYTLNGKCYDKCPDGFIEHEHSCIKISTDTCPSGFSELSGKFCVESCPEKHSTVGGRCLAKPICGEGEFNMNGKCIKKCPSGYIADPETKACEVNRTFCSGSNLLLNNQCIKKEECKEKKMNEDTIFNLCSAADQCKPGHYYFGLFCLDKCPLGYEAYIGTCKKKASTSCEKGVYHDGKCVEQCPDGYIPKLGVCVQLQQMAVQSSGCGINMIPVQSDGPSSPFGCECKEGFIPRPGQSYCIPKEPKCPSNHSLDAVFIIEASERVTESEFNTMKLFILEALTHIYSAKSNIRVGLVIVGPAKPVVVYLYKFKRECDVIQYMTSLQILGGKETTIIHGLRISRELVFSQCNGARIGVARQLYTVAMEDNFSQELRDELTKEIQLHKDSGHRVAFITVGKTTDLPANVYNLNVEDISKLSRYSYKLAEIACNDFVCPNGYERVESECKDIDECGKMPCHDNAWCFNEPGGFKCFCQPNLEYIDDTIGCAVPSKKCTDGGKREIKNVCDVIQCVGGANCSSSNGMGFCVCEKGFVYKQDVGCVDHNECTLSPCLDNATCINQHGSFDCICHKGFQYNKHFGCIDINECETLKSPCSGNGQCHNIKGSYNCICEKGFEYVKDVGCKDINECTIPRLCKGDNVKCQNTEGSFRCVCEKGYEYTSEGCKDINECITLGMKACGKGAVCKNLEPGYDCTCEKGFFYDNTTSECKVDETKGILQRKADMVFVVDSGDNMRKALFGSVRTMLKEIVSDYRNNSATVKKLFFGMTIGGGNQTEIAFAKSTGEEAEAKMDDLKYIGGQSSILMGLKEARTLYTNQGQTNATKMVFLVTATNLPTDADKLREIKKEAEAIKSEGLLIVIHVGTTHKKTDWLGIFTEKEVEKYVIVVAEAFIKTVHSLIYQKSDTLIACPDGFIFLDNVCQYKTHNAKYCKFDDKLYALNSTWKSECSLMQCTDEGVRVLNKECMGYDGDCYEVGSQFPCNVKGELNWRCRCLVTNYTEKETGHYQQQISYTIIYFDPATTSNETKTEDGFKCEFPFKYEKKWYYACSDIKSAKRWCSHHHEYDARYYSYCKRNVQQQCVVNGKIYKEGEMWTHGCNDIHCLTGRLSITVKCQTAENTCVPLDSMNYPCIVNGKRYSKCICTQDSEGYGKNAALGGSFEGKKDNHTSSTVSFCEQRTTGERHEHGEEWLQECFKLKCNDGVTSILEKNCVAEDNSCHAPGTSGFPCKIKSELRSNCTCELDGDNLALVAYTHGKKVSEETKGSVVFNKGISSRKTISLLEEEKK